MAIYVPANQMTGKTMPTIAPLLVTFMKYFMTSSPGGELKERLAIYLLPISGAGFELEIPEYCMRCELSLRAIQALTRQHIKYRRSPKAKTTRDL